jgi:hypothetical protein
MANGAQSGIRLIERPGGYACYWGDERFPVSALASTGPFANETQDELRAASEWLVTQRQAEREDELWEILRLFPLRHPTATRRRGVGGGAGTTRSG